MATPAETAARAARMGPPGMGGMSDVATPPGPGMADGDALEATQALIDALASGDPQQVLDALRECQEYL